MTDTKLSRAEHVIAPDQLVSILIGSESVTLRGFGGVPAKLPFWIPVVQEFNPALSAASALEVRELLGALQRVSIALGIVCSFILMFWAGSFFASASSNKSPMVWAVKFVEPKSLAIVVGTAMVHVPVGGLLPNGDTLRSVDPARQSFVTDNQITVVKN